MPLGSQQLSAKKVNLATTYLNDMLDVWYQRWSRMRIELNWTEFVVDFYDRFGERTLVDVIEEFNN